MKTALISFFLLTTFSLCAQEKRYFNWDRKPCEAANARFLSLVDKTDSGWVERSFFLSTQKSQMKGLYKDSALKIKNGWFRYFYVNQLLASEGKYVNGRKDGIWLDYHLNGMMKDSVMYSMDLPVMKMSWYANGAIKDSSVTSIDGDGLHAYWFDNGQPSHSGRTYRGKKEKKWQYFHQNGKLAAIEEYEQDKLLSRQYFDEEGVQQADTTVKDKAAEFKGGNSKWRSYLANTLEFPGGVSLKNTTMITVVVNAVVDEGGNITDAYVSVPVHPKFDDEALRIMKKSPKWMPAIDHNRKVKFYIRQPISFSQVEN